MCFLRVHTLLDCRELLPSDDEEVHDEDGQEDVHEEGEFYTDNMFEHVIILNLFFEKIFFTYDVLIFFR